MIDEIDAAVTIAGSFKYKPEIDRAIDEFIDNGVEVLAPEKGWLYIPRLKLLTVLPADNFRPLPSEIGMNPLQVENEFLRAVANSQLLYIVNPDGYIGEVVSMEIGFAMALGIPIFSQYPFNTNLDPDPFWAERLNRITVMSISEVVQLIKEQNV